MTYKNEIVTRTAPLTRCQCAVLAVLNSEWSDLGEVWLRNPVYCSSKFGRVEPVSHGTIGQVLKSLAEQGFAECEDSNARHKKYRTKHPE